MLGKDGLAGGASNSQQMVWEGPLMLGPERPKGQEVGHWAEDVAVVEHLLSRHRPWD